ncbi:MAG: hypothetical protein HKM04_02070 [Legionellales bacterium]|nr:hypothetical protein [Legionellales bacterium]
MLSKADKKLVQETIQLIIDNNELSEFLTFAHYSKTITFLSGLIKEKKADQLLPHIKQLLQESGNDLVKEQYILSTGQMPNASLLAAFYCPKNNANYAILIENGKFKEYATPAGKIDKEDIVLSANNTVDIDKTYINAALREFAQEALKPEAYDAFKSMIKIHRLKNVNRDELGIPEFNKDFDTRLFTLDLGKVDSAVIQTMLKPRDEQNLDSIETFIVDIKKLGYNHPELEAVADGKFTNYFLTIEGRRLKARPTALITLNGTVDKPELGFATDMHNKIAARINKKASGMFGSAEQPQNMMSPQNVQDASRQCYKDSRI